MTAEKADAADPRQTDPRHIVTPDAFEVSPELLGRPLAHPWRRGAALIGDLAVVALLMQGGAIAFSTAAAAIFFVLVVLKPATAWWRRVGRVVLALGGALVLWLGLLVLLYQPPKGMTSFGAVPVEQWAQFGMLTGIEDPEKRAAATEELMSELMASGLEPTDVSQMLDGLDLPPEARSALETLSMGVETAIQAEETPPPDPAALAAWLEGYAQALKDGDEEQRQELHPKVEQAVAGPLIARLRRQVELLRENTTELYDQLGELRRKVEDPGFLGIVRGLATDLGLSFGWGAAYFTLFTAWWRGRTPGKWLFRLRVVRLDGTYLGLWGSFERFAGYAAGLATGLLGFFQVFWDPNRQAIQDKVVGTVVVSPER